MLHLLLLHLVSDARALREGVGYVSELPRLRSDQDADALGEALRSLDLQATRQDDAFDLRMPLPGLGVRARFRVEANHGWIRFHAQLSEAPTLALSRLDPRFDSRGAGIGGFARGQAASDVGSALGSAGREAAQVPTAVGSVRS